MSQWAEQVYSQTVVRHVPARVRVISFLLYAAVAFFAIIGTMGGLYWGIMAVGTLVLAWYLKGQARVSYHYELTGSRLRVERTSGFESRQRTEVFASFDLTRLRVLAPEGDPSLEEAERETANLRPKRITYDISAHDPRADRCVMFLEGVGEEQGRWLKVTFQPDAELRAAIRRTAPGKVRGFDRPSA